MERVVSAAKPRAASSLTSLSDGIVLERLAAGDLMALGVLYDRYAVTLLRFARRVERDEADDIIQTVFLRVVRLAATFDAQSPSARPWLYAITARVLQERRRALRRWTSALLRLAEEPVRKVFSASDTRHDLDTGLARLSMAKRTVLLLAEVEGFSCDEIATMLSIPVGTVWTRLHHARRELRRFHEEQP
jgi:RNA polymerase sigma-70 factor (ECF subfamily)